MRAPLPLGAITAPWRYGGPLADALQRLKFAGQAWVARGLAPAVGPFLDAVVEAGAIDVIVPVPLHWWRRTRRGFDQAALLAAAARPPAPVRPAMLRRVRPTRPQLELGRAARANNLVGAFVVPRRHRAALAGRRVLLVDDVVTTGATVRPRCSASRWPGPSASRAAYNLLHAHVSRGGTARRGRCGSRGRSARASGCGPAGGRW
jgi:ComF family protein